MSTTIKIENLSKQYRLGQVGTGTISHDLNRWWANFCGKEDPYSTVGDTNKRDQAAESEYVWALKDINLEVQEGEVLGIIGANGAGKSTLLKLISRITSPTTGCIKAKGRIASLLEVGTGMHPEMTARENVFMNGSILGMTRFEISKKFDDIIEFAGCKMFVDTPVKRFSSGMYVRLAFAVAAFLEPEILIVDEVLAVGDAEFQKRALGKMKDVSQSGRTIIFVSHNLGSVRALCSRAAWMDSGKLNSVGPCENVVLEYSSRSCELASANAGEMATRTGSRELTIDDLLVTNAKGIRSRNFLVGEPIQLSLKVSSSGESISCSPFVVIRNAVRDPLISSFYYDQHSCETVSKTDFVVQTQGMSLRPGTYTLDVGLVGADRQIIDWIQDATALTIDPYCEHNQPFDNRVGQLSIPFNWQLDPEVE